MFLVSVIWTLPRRLSSDHPLRLGNSARIQPSFTVPVKSITVTKEVANASQTSLMSPRPKERRWYGIFFDISALKETGAALG
jgi:hypothetical protein